MPHTGALKYVCWPLVTGRHPNNSDLAGSLAIVPSHRRVLKEACQRMDGLGDFSQGLKIMERAWQLKDIEPNTEIHWRDIMRGNGWSLLFS
jgi:hypothetical protein